MTEAQGLETPIANFHSYLINKTVFMNFNEDIPKPPKALDLHTISHLARW